MKALSNQLVFVFMVVFLAVAPAALACETKIECGPYSDDTNDGCLGSDDPFCDDDGGSGEITYEHTLGCYECRYIPQGPNGEPSYFYCHAVAAGEGNGKPAQCSDYSWGCDMKGMCQLT